MVGQGILELLIGNEKVTDRQKTYRHTDLPTDMCKAICLLFFKGGHSYILNSLTLDFVKELRFFSLEPSKQYA